MVSGVLDPILLPSAITVSRTHPHLLMDILSSFGTRLPLRFKH